MSNEYLDPYDFKMREVRGVPIYYKNFPTSPCIHVRFVFQTGAFDDPIGKEGLSHFFEHLIFTGSPQVPDKKAVREWSKKYALNSWNAGTYFTSTNYNLRCLPDAYGEVLHGMKDMIFSPFLREEDVEQERKVITQEAWGRFLNEKYLAYVKESVENGFPEHVRGRFYTPLGWPNTINAITRDDIVSWHKEHYGIGNVFIVLTGAVGEEHVDAWGEILKDVPAAVRPSTVIGTTGKPKTNRIVKNSSDIGKEAEQVEIEIGRTVPPQPIAERYRVYMLCRLLTDVLYERLRIEKSLCYGVTVGAQFARTYGTIYMHIKTDEQNIALVERELDILLREVEHGDHVDRFERIKALYLEQILSREELASDVANTVFSEISAYDKPVTTQDEIENIKQIAYEDMIRLSSWAFDPEYLVTEIILPSKK